MEFDPIQLPRKWSKEYYWRTVMARAFVVAQESLSGWPWLTGTAKALLWVLWVLGTTGLVVLACDGWRDRLGVLGWAGLVLIAVMLVRWLDFARWVLFGLPIFGAVSILFAFRNPPWKMRNPSEEVLEIGLNGNVVSIGTRLGNLVLAPNVFRAMDYRDALLVYAIRGIDPLVVIPKSHVPAEWIRMLREQLAPRSKAGER